MHSAPTWQGPERSERQHLVAACDERPVGFLVCIRGAVRRLHHRAIALYERAGFVLEGIKRAAIRIDGRPVDERVMGKVLAG